MKDITLIRVKKELVSKIKYFIIDKDMNITEFIENAIKDKLGITSTVNKLNIPKVNLFEEELSKLSNYSTTKSTVEIVDENGLIRERNIATNVLE
jgi:hypothetical protein